MNELAIMAWCEKYGMIFLSTLPNQEIFLCIDQSGKEWKVPYYIAKEKKDDGKLCDTL